MKEVMGECKEVEQNVPNYPITSQHLSNNSCLTNENIAIVSSPCIVVTDVELVKGPYGLGIYFAEDSASGLAVVDPKVPFYRLPDGLPAPGEASKKIKQSDILIGINGQSVEAIGFASVVDSLRQAPEGPILLTFARQIFTLPSDSSLPLMQKSKLKPEIVPMEEVIESLNKRIHDLEAQVERERKCRFLTERKNAIYRQELIQLGEETSRLRYEIALSNEAVKAFKHPR